MSGETGGRRGRPRKASNVLELTGRFKHNPDQRTKRKLEPKGVALLSDEPPKWMTKEQRACYRELIRRCHPDVLSMGDSCWVEITACMLSEYRQSPTSFGPAKTSRLLLALGAMGMSPADRSRAAKMPSRQQNPFDAVLKKTAAAG